MRGIVVANGKGKDAFQRYLEDVAASQPLSAEEEALLSRRIQDGDSEARAKLVNANLRFVVAIARKYQNREMSLEDLVSAGNEGLIIATERFDGTRGVKFITYAVWWIRQTILQALGEHSRLVRLPLNKMHILCRISRYLKNQQRGTSTCPTLEEVAEALSTSVEEVVVTLNSSQRVLSLDATPSGDNENCLLQVIPDNSQEPPDVVLMRNALQEEIGTALDGLKEREKEIIRLYFGLDGAQQMNLEEIGSKYGLTRERIRQIKDEALRKLRHPARARKLMPYYAEEFLWCWTASPLSVWHC